MNKNYEIVVDGSGRIVRLKVDGKVKGMRDLNKAQDTNYWKLYENDGVGKNRFSGVEVDLDYFELSIYAFCINWVMRYERGMESLPVQVFDSMKYLLLAINANAYMELLD
jgi:hypothetical protein